MRRLCHISGRARRPAVWVVVVGLGLLLSACTGEDSPVEPSVMVEGAWAGTVNDDQRGQGTITMNVVQAGTNASGIYAMTFADPADELAGSFTGTFSGRRLLLSSRPSDPVDCPLQIVLDVATNRLSGDYTAISCAGEERGTVDLTRQ